MELFILIQFYEQYIFTSSGLDAAMKYDEKKPLYTKLNEVT